MATPTATSYTRNLNHRAYTVWTVTWGSGTADDFTDEIVVNLSDINSEYNSSLKVTYVSMLASTGVELKLEFDADTDQPIATYPLGASSSVEMDFTPLIDAGLPKVNTGGTGDVVLTTSSAADGDSAFILIEYYLD